jgi:hypothetical protein
MGFFSMSTSQQRPTVDGDLLSILLRKAADLDLQIYELNKLRYRLRQVQQFPLESFPMMAQHPQTVAEGSALSM